MLLGTAAVELPTSGKSIAFIPHGGQILEVMKIANGLHILGHVFGEGVCVYLCAPLTTRQNVNESCKRKRARLT